MYKGKFFKVGPFRKHSPTSEREKAGVINADKYNYLHRVMEFLRSAALWVGYQDLDLNRFQFMTSRRKLK